MKHLETISAKPGLVVKVSDAFCCVEGHVFRNTMGFINGCASPKLYLLTFEWAKRQIYYEIDPHTLELKEEREMELDFGEEGQPRRLVLSQYDRDMSVRMKHAVIKEHLLGHLRLEAYRVSGHQQLFREGTAQLCFLLPEQPKTVRGQPQKSSRAFVVKFHEDCEYFDNVELAINLAARDHRLEDFLQFSALQRTGKLGLTQTPSTWSGWWTRCRPT